MGAEPSSFNQGHQGMEGRGKPAISLLMARELMMAPTSLSVWGGNGKSDISFIWEPHEMLILLSTRSLVWT